METIFLDSTPVHDGCWLTRINSAYLERFAPHLPQEASMSVVLVDEAEYDANGQALTVSGGNIQPVVIGIRDTAIVLMRQINSAPGTGKVSNADPATGDQAFLNEARRLPDWAKEAAPKILRAIRQIDSGQLERGKRNKFINRPNNFWTITAQPQAKGFAITIYGRPHLFKSNSLMIQDDRPGHSRFVIRGPSQVAEAIRLIKESKDMKS